MSDTKECDQNIGIYALKVTESLNENYCADKHNILLASCHLLCLAYEN